VDRKYFDVRGYFAGGSNWLQLRPPQRVSRYETGVSLPSVKTLVKIAKILKKPATNYFGYFRLYEIVVEERK